MTHYIWKQLIKYKYPNKVLKQDVTPVWGSQNVPLWAVDYFERKAIKTQWTQENLIPLPYVPKKISIGTCPRKRAIPEITFDVAGQTSALLIRL